MVAPPEDGKGMGQGFFLHYSINVFAYHGVLGSTDQIQVLALYLVHHRIHFREAHNSRNYEAELTEKLTKNMMVIPNIIDPSVPIGKDDSENVELERFGEPVIPDFEVPYHTDIKAHNSRNYAAADHERRYAVGEASVYHARKRALTALRSAECTAYTSLKSRK